jgi:hypothetical protein
VRLDCSGPDCKTGPRYGGRAARRQKANGRRTCARA